MYLLTRPYAKRTPAVHLMGLTLVLAVLSGVGAAGATGQAQGVLVYRGAGDASAAVPVGDGQFVMADDEDNVLRVYSTAKPGLPLVSYDLAEWLDVEPDHPEVDIEGATRVGERIYWISSHGRNKDGKYRPNRYRFFATDIRARGRDVAIVPVGAAYKRLVDDLLADEWAKELGLHKAVGLDAGRVSTKKHERLAPKERGLNIEGLCASADGRVLYVGFRNPRPSGRALVVPLLNGDDVVMRRTRARFGEPMLWDLDSLGVRSMEYSAYHRAYFVVAGPHDEAERFALYRWSGQADEQPRLARPLRRALERFTPEALVCVPDSDDLLLLSDDGTVPVRVSHPSQCAEGELNSDGSCPNKFLVNPMRKTFRAFWIRP